MKGYHLHKPQRIAGVKLTRSRQFHLPLVCTMLGFLILTTGCTTLQPTQEGVVASGFIEGRNYSLATETGGTVLQVLVEEGDGIQMDQALVVLDSAAFESLRAQAQAAVQAAQAVLQGLHDQPSDEDVLIAQAGLDEAQAKQDAAEAELALLIAGYEPLDPPDVELHLAETAVEVAKAETQLAQAELERIQAGASPGEIDVAEAELAEAEANLALLDLQIEMMTLRSPVEGVVGQVLVSVGETATAGAPLIQVIDLSDLKLTVYVPETQVAELAVGDPVSVMVDAYPDETWEGNIARIADRAQFTPSNVQTLEERVKLVFAVEIAVDDPSLRMKAGMPADVNFNP